MSIVSLGNLFGKYKPYPKYRKSGVYWLEEIPELWDIRPIWVLFIRKSDKGHEELQLLSVYRDYGVIPTDSRDDNFNKPSLDLSNYLRVTPTDLVTNKMKTWQGSIAVSEYEGIVSPAYYTFRAVHREHHKYIHYLLRCEKYVSIYMSLSKGIRVNQWDLEYQSFRNVPVLLPSFNEQQAIADFLDREIAKIDELIAKKQRLIELLQEQRTALITRTVTKGLNPQAPMKDSGVEWLDEIPAHWEVRRLRFLTRINPNKRDIGDLPPSTEVDFIPMEDVGYGFLKKEKTLELASVSEGYTFFRDGNVLVAKITPCFENGKGAVCEGLLNGIGFGTTELHVIHPSGGLDGRFLLYVTLSHTFRNIGESEMYGTAGQKRLPDKFIRDFICPYPSIQEQHTIIEYLDRETSRIDTLISKTNQAIGKLQEYRSALITAAVTGKINVRTKGAVYD